MRFRIFILEDPDERDRGYSLKGIKVPLTTYTPVEAPRNILSYDDSPAYGKYAQYWKIPTCLLVLARPQLSRHLKGIDNLLVPTDWCDVAPIGGR